MMVTNKTVKASLFTLILAFIVIGTVAIAGVMKKEMPVEVEQVLATKTWHFSGTDPLDETDYTLVGSTPPNCPGLPETICTIQAPEDSNGNPDMEAVIGGSTVEDLIKEALSSIDEENPTPNDAVLSFKSRN